MTGGTRGFLIRRNWIVVEGFEIASTSSHGIYATGAAFVTIRGNYVHHVGQQTKTDTAKGIYLKDVTDSTIEGNTVDQATDAGIAVFGASARVIVRGNTSNRNARGYVRAAVGIDIRNASVVTVENNRLSENEDSGINVWDSADVIVRGNVASRNGDHGIDNKASINTAIVANTVYGGVDSGIEVVGTATGVTVMNNISVDNGINSPRTTGNLRVDGTALGAVQLDFNLVWLSQAGDMIVWGNDRYSTLASFVSATGQMANGKETDPKFANAGTGDFRLLPGSAAIDAANANAPGQAPVDSTGQSRVDDPATPNTGAGVRAFDDIGAFEYVPSGPADQPPVAVSDSATVQEGSAATVIDVLANDTDPDGGPKSVGSVTQPVNGTVTIGQDGAHVTYAPKAGYCNTGSGPDTFGYTLTPGGSSATVSMTVTCAQQTPVLLILLPAGDATIRQARPTSANGSGTVLSVDGDPVKDVLIKFAVSGVGTKTIKRAAIKLWCVDSSGTGGTFHTVSSSSWDENTVTWATAPSFDPTPFRTMGPVESGNFYEVDVTDKIIGDGDYSFRVDLISIYDAGYSSKEEPDDGRRPRLIIEFQ